ncbi:hypothetical protein HK096_008087 [Nowakowskiella sp. JEL0078]|nr:hypothetical protein HK096_008087 [Nowakowskiella sp. JEL0078]
MPFVYHEEKLPEYRDAFSLFDSDQDQLLTYTEVGTVIRALGANPTESEILRLAKEADTNKDEKVDFGEFLIVLGNQSLANKDMTTEVKEAFKIFDKEGTGIISASELRHVLTSLGEKLSQEQVDDLLKELDPKGSGSVEFAAFSKYLLN